MTRAFIALGANLGERAVTIEQAISALDRLPSTHVVKRARVIEVAALLPPEDPTPQPAYLNTVVELATSLEPEDLLRELKALERALGRTPAARRWAPRIIDLDLILWGTRVENSDTLTIPHPQMHLRRFVLEPLAELAPELIHPVLRKTVAALLAELPGR